MERTIRHAVGGLLLACVLIAPAAAQHPNDRAGLQGVGAVAATQDVAVAVSPSLRPDGREMPDGVDLAPTPPTIVAADDGFDWDDAGIGLAGGLGLALVLVGVLAATQHARRMPGAS
jgi:hypothetical protein